MHVEGYSEVGDVVVLIGPYYEYKFRADHFQGVGYSCQNELSTEVYEEF